MPIFSDEVPSQYYLHVISDRWLNAEHVVALSFKGITLPEHVPPHTELLALQPLPKKALKNKDFEGLYNFSHFNRVQTQVNDHNFEKDKKKLQEIPFVFY